MMGRIGEAVEALVEVVARLRGPNGCPWDRAQTHTSLIPYLLEEAYETAEALEKGIPERIKEELGDLLLQVALHAQIEAEAGRFDLGDVASALREKLIRRHRHVFGDVKATTPAEVRKQWEEFKREEGKGLDLARPALIAARKYIEAHPDTVAPVPSHIPSPEKVPARPEEEIGKLLYSICVLAHRWGVEPELALRRHLKRLEDGE